MDLLSMLQEVKKESLILNHPLVMEDVSLRYAYAMGVAIVAGAEEVLGAEGKMAVEELAYGLNMTETQCEKILETLAKPEKNILQTVVQSVCQKEWQYLFLADVRRLACRNGIFGEKHEKALDIFRDLFKLSLSERKISQDFIEAVFSESFEETEKMLLKIYADDEDAVYRALVYYFSKSCKDELKKIDELVEKENNKKKIQIEQLRSKPDSCWWKPYVAEGRIKPLDEETGEGRQWMQKKQKNEAEFSDACQKLQTKKELFMAAIDNMYRA